MTPQHSDPTQRNSGHSPADASRKPPAQLRTLRAFCLVEAATLLVLVLVAVPLKHLAGDPRAVSMIGPIHGFVFLAFGWMVVKVAASGDISGKEAAKLMFAAFLPFGGIYSWWILR